MEYNGYSDEMEFDQAFDYKNIDGVSYWLQGSRLCTEYHKNQISNLTKLVSFINNTNACNIIMVIF